MLNVIMLSVVILNVVMLSVVAPQSDLISEAIVDKEVSERVIQVGVISGQNVMKLFTTAIYKCL